MKLVSYTIASIIIFSIFNCQADSKAESSASTKHIFAKYYVRYLQTEKELKAEAYFKEGDTLSKARSIVLANVIFENTPMEAQNLGKNYGLRYAYRKNGPYRKQYEFKYKDEELGQFSHFLDMSPITDFLIKEGSISKKAGTTLVWKGDPLTDNQELILLFTDQDKKAFPIQISGPTDRTEVFIPNEKITDLSLGEGKLMIVKKQVIESQETNFAKISEMEFYSNKISVDIVE